MSIQHKVKMDLPEDKRADRVTFDLPDRSWVGQTRNPSAAFLAAILVFVAFVSPAQSISSHRQRITDGWQFVKHDLGGVWEAVRPVRAGRPEALPLWQQVQLPHCYNAFDAVHPDVNYYQGPAWYRTVLQVDNPYENGRTLLHFEGAGQKTEVYVGLEKAGEHVGGYDEWTVDITEFIQHSRKDDRLSEIYDGKIPLSIRCDNSRDLEMIPSDLSDFNLYGGLYRYVNLVYVPGTYIKRVHAQPEIRKGRLGRVTFHIGLQNFSGEPITLDLTITDPAGETVYRSQISADLKEVSHTADIGKVLLWSTDTPRLYRFSMQLNTDSGRQDYTGHFGFREFLFEKHGPFYLNGRRLLLRGTHRHEDHAGTGAAMTEKMIREEMVLIKEMGTNFIRLGHYQQSRIVLNLCDSLGLLVWEEIPWCRGGLGGPMYKEQARRMLHNMIDQHFNHPSVIIWGLGNENDWPGDAPEFDQTEIRSFMQELNDLSHTLDPSRKTGIRRCDFCKDIVDVYSPSIWAGWYRGKFTDYKEVSRNNMLEVDHFFHMEWGGSSHAGRHSEDPDIGLEQVVPGQGADERLGDAALIGGEPRVSRDGNWSETYMCNLFDWHLKEQETMEWLTGAAQWIFKDFSTPIRPDNPIPYMNQKGVVERDLTKKASYYVFQSYWSEKPMVHIYGHTWPVRWGEDGEEKLIKVYSNCAEVELFANGVSCGTKERNSQDFPAAGLRWHVPFDKGSHVLLAVGRSGTQTVTDTIRFFYETTSWSDPAVMVVDTVDVSGTLATVRVRVQDVHGTLCADAPNVVRFSYSGNGAMLADLGTATGSRKVELQNGTAEIQVLLARSGGTLWATSDGLLPVRVELVPGPVSDIPDMTRNQGHLLLESHLIDRARRAVDRRDPSVMPAYRALLDSADRAMKGKLYSVMNKEYTPPSGDKHDYVSMGKYWWPNPDTPSGLPYVQRDGEVNPEKDQFDRDPLHAMMDGVRTLAYAYSFSGDERYARKAVLLLRTWFLDPETKMNPHLQYAQHIPGRTEGRGIGIIDTRKFANLPDILQLLGPSVACSPAFVDEMKVWLNNYLDWLWTSDHGHDERNAQNNHGTVYAVLTASLALYLERPEIYLTMLGASAQERIDHQIRADGRQPLELRRTRAYHYSVLNAYYLMQLSILSERAEMPLMGYAGPEGQRIRKALEFILPYANGKRAWPYQQITPWPYEFEWTYRLFAMAAYYFDDISYRMLLEAIPLENAEHLLVNLKYCCTSSSNFMH